MIQTKILKGLIVQLMNPGTLFNAQKNTSIYSYVSTLQREADNGPALANIIISNCNKMNCIVLFGSPDPKEFPKLKENKT